MKYEQQQVGRAFTCFSLFLVFSTYNKRFTIKTNINGENMLNKQALSKVNFA